ncbi:MAG: hypothetical protein V1740_02440 [Candidatus Woesearchaeota archaeon]
MVILLDYFNLPDNIFEIIFSTPQQSIVARVLLNYMKSKGNELTKTEMSVIATQLHEGKFVAELDQGEYKGRIVKLSYNKRQFYDRIVTPMKSMGLIDYDLYQKKYKISKKFTDVLRNLGLMWQKEVDTPLENKMPSFKKIAV